MNSFSAFSQGQHRDYLELCYQGGNITCTEEYTYFCVTSEQSEIHKSLPKRLCFSFYLTCFRKLFGLWENVKSQRLTQILWVEEDLCVFVYLQACVCARLCVNLRVCVCVCVRACTCVSSVERPRTRRIWIWSEEKVTPSLMLNV